MANVNWQNNFKTGFSGNVAIGYQFLPCVRWEAEFVWQNFKRDISGGFDFRELVALTSHYAMKILHVTPVSNRANIYALMANAYYEFSSIVIGYPLSAQGLVLSECNLIRRSRWFHLSYDNRQAIPAPNVQTAPICMAMH